MRVVAKKINNPECDYITEGKVYYASDISRYGFDIKDDCGDVLRVLFRSCGHISGNWTIIGNPAVAVKSEEV